MSQCGEQSSKPSRVEIDMHIKSLKNKKTAGEDRIFIYKYINIYNIIINIIIKACSR